MNQEDQDKLNQIEADAHRGVFSERDVCALIQCYREKCAELADVQKGLDICWGYLSGMDKIAARLQFEEEQAHGDSK